MKQFWRTSLRDTSSHSFLAGNFWRVWFARKHFYCLDMASTGISLILWPFSSHLWRSHYKMNSALQCFGFIGFSLAAFVKGDSQGEMFGEFWTRWSLVLFTASFHFYGLCLECLHWWTTWTTSLEPCTNLWSCYSRLSHAELSGVTSPQSWTVSAKVTTCCLPCTWRLSQWVSGTYCWQLPAEQCKLQEQMFQVASANDCTCKQRQHDWIASGFVPPTGQRRVSTDMSTLKLCSHL